MRMIQLYKTFLFIIIFLSGGAGFSQSINYWSVNLNSEAALLGGAVVGGGSGITSIYYNPAGISEVKKSNVSLNTSMFSLVNKAYKDALGEGEDLSQVHFEIKPRFASYLFRSKKFIDLSWQLAVFNRDSRNLFLRGSYEDDAVKYGLSKKEKYLGLYDYWEVYNDYYIGIGASYEFNDKLVIGVSAFVSMKDLRVTNQQNTSISSLKRDSRLTDPSNWYYYRMLTLFDVRIVPKLGIKYLITDEISLGITFNFPSFDVFNYANATKTLSHSNIQDNTGKKVQDSYQAENINYVKAQIKDPFSIAVGMRRQPTGSKNIYSMTVEWFSHIKIYKAVDAETGKSIFGEEVYGTEFSNYYMANRSVINFAFGYKREVKKQLELLFGFKSDFLSYYIPNNFYNEHKTANTFIKVGADLMHITAGANFIFKNKFKINLGGQLSYGRSTNNTQLMNFVDANWYNYDTGLAIQGERKDIMKYRYIILGLFLGFSLDF